MQSVDYRTYEAILEEGREAGAWLLSHPDEIPPPVITACCQNAQQFLKGLLLEDPAMAHAIRAELIRVKREYDANGPSEKTPFALKDMPEGSFERQLLFVACLNEMGTVHGCSGACKKCGVDAFPVHPKNIEPIPTDQKMHFIRELAQFLTSVTSDYRASLSEFHWYSDTDLMNDPDVEVLVRQIYKILGISNFSFLSSIPRGSEARIVNLVASKEKAKRVKSIKSLLTAYEKNDFNSIGRQRGLPYEIRDALRIWAKTGSIPEEKLEELRQTLSELETEVADMPPELKIWISGNFRNLDTVRSLERQGLAGHFNLHRREGSANTGGAFKLLGVSLAKKVEAEKIDLDSSLQGIGTGSYMQIKPFGINNVVWGLVSEGYYQGRVVVPFQGLTEETPLAREGQPISRLLRHSMVIKSILYNGDPRKLESKIIIFDKDGRFRAITFDLHTYRVLKEDVLFTKSDLSPENPWDDLLRRIQSAAG